MDSSIAKKPTAFKLNAEIFLVTSCHLAAMRALRCAIEKCCGIEILAIAKEDWRPKPFEAMQTPDGNFCNFRHGNLLFSSF